MRVDSSNARAQVQAAKPQQVERKPERKPEVAKAEAKPAPQAAKQHRVDVRA